MLLRVVRRSNSDRRCHTDDPRRRNSAVFDRSEEDAEGSRRREQPGCSDRRGRTSMAASDETASTPQEEMGGRSGYPKYEGEAEDAHFLRIVWGSRGSVRLAARKAGRVPTRSAGRGVCEGRGGKSLPSRPRAGSRPASGQWDEKSERRQVPPLAWDLTSHVVRIVSD